MLFNSVFICNLTSLKKHMLTFDFLELKFFESPHFSNTFSVMRHFMKITPLIFLLFCSTIIFSCNKVEKNETLLVASQKFNDLDTIHKEFKIYADSSFQFEKIVKEIDHESQEKWTGNVKIYNDTIKFEPFALKYNRSETAVLKNGFIEFIDGEEPDRMKIEKSSLSSIKNIDFSNFSKIAVFTFYKKFHPLQDEKNLVNYDLKTEELQKIESILKIEFRKNKKLRNYDDYLKQISAVKNLKNEIIIKAHFFCESPHIIESFEYYETGMMDGGNCNVYLELNFTSKEINFINIAGIA